MIQNNPWQTHQLTEDVVNEYITEILSAIISDRDISASMTFKYATIALKNDTVYIDVTKGEAVQVERYIETLEGLFSVGQYVLKEIVVSDIVTKNFIPFKLPSKEAIWEEMQNESNILVDFAERFELEIE